MSKFLERIASLVETFSGPIDWYRERVDGCVSYSGRFLVHDRRGMIRSHVPGRIVQRNERVAEVYLYDPPRYLLKHKHGRCMQLLTPNDKWFKLHFDRPAANFSEAYTYVEHLLTEAHNHSH